MKNKLYNEPFEHYENEPKDNSNLIMGIGLGVMIIVCGIIYVSVSFLEAVMY